MFNWKLVVYIFLKIIVGYYIGKHDAALFPKAPDDSVE